jgi:HD-GYP domain-containing protein (c-di-GMP phosphodiesterase class II)
VKQSIRLKGYSDEVRGKVWEADTLLRAGRLGSLEIVLDDSSVSRRHAELRYQPPAGWVVRDLESTNGTYLNGVRLGPGEKPIRPKDIVQFGKIALMVEAVESGPSAAETPAVDQIRVETTTSSSWEDGFQNLVLDRNGQQRPVKQIIALVRAGQQVSHLASEKELLDSILNDAVQVLDAQRGAIVLAEGSEEKLKLKALATGHGEPAGRFHFSQKLARRVFERKESILCCSVNDDPELAAAQSIADGAMASVLCVLLRTPRRPLGVLHLDRSFFQKPFTEEDLNLADALAAHVSAGIECAQLLRKQKELFQDTIEVLSQAVELKDEYTGGHTRRVKMLALMLGEEIGLSEEELELLRLGTPLHDIGKIGIKDDILLKPGKLTAEEFEIMKTHTTKGEAIVSMIPNLDPRIRPIVRSHHERWNGKGYPDGLAGEAIPLLARVVAVVDAFDAMTSDRPYHPDKKGRPMEEAFAEVQKQAGQQFDPRCAASFLAIQSKVTESLRSDHQTALVSQAVRSEVVRNVDSKPKSEVRALK